MLTKLIPIVEEAGALALGHFHSLAPTDVDEKGHLDLVTIADRAVEVLLAERLQAAFPGDGVYGEEGTRDMGQTGRIWVIDPIDGTFNFVRGRDDWAVSVGLYDGVAPVLGAVLQPVRRRLLTGGRDVAPCLDGRPLAPLTPFRPEVAAVQLGNGGGDPKVDVADTLRLLSGPGQAMARMTNAATAAMMELVMGQVDGYVSCGDSSWDLMGTWSIATALGATSTLDWAGFGLQDRGHFVIGKQGLVDMCTGIGLFA
ncbi:Inositol-1-monophosphatase [Marinibacterium anthonyi]|nr:Inositol-1-monophosphatase [Marinibacterium anthonyi]